MLHLRHNKYIIVARGDGGEETAVAHDYCSYCCVLVPGTSIISLGYDA